MSRASMLLIIFLFPILFIIHIILIIFGQHDDGIMAAFTETYSYSLSKKIPTVDLLESDGHYLCTVSLKGHKKLVKPLRYGWRHNHYIMVNRQLLIANAFEQLLQEYMPKIHFIIRRNYDKYGLSIAKYIQNSWLADLTYILMKPLEYFFLFCLYLFDTQPEKRISSQYISKEIFDIYHRNKIITEKEV